MLQKKRSLFLFLLLAFSLQTAQAETSTMKALSDWFKNYTQFDWGRDYSQPLKIGVAATLFAALVAYNYFGWGGFKSKEKTMVEVSLPPVHNIQVASQDNNDCGYHALKNGIVFLEHANSGEDLKDVTDDRFTDKKAYKTLLQDWKKAIVLHRKKQVLKNLLHLRADGQIKHSDFSQIITSWSALEKSLVEKWIDGQYRGKLKNSYSTEAEIAVDALNNIENQEQKYTITSKRILENIPATIIWEGFTENEQLKSILVKDNLDENTPLYHDILEKNKHIKIDQIQYTINNAELTKLFKTKYSSPYNDNLESGEIYTLFLHPKEFVSQENRQHFSFIDDIDQAIPKQELISLVKPEVDKDTKEIFLVENFDTMKAAWHNPNKENYAHVFILGTMSQEEKNKGGHWYMLGAQKLDGNKNYFVADSLNIDRTNDTNVLTLINAIEKKPEPEKTD